MPKSVVKQQKRELSAKSFFSQQSLMEFLSEFNEVSEEETETGDRTTLETQTILENKNGRCRNQYLKQLLCLLENGSLKPTQYR
ncbi:hypothetical protein SESBI_17894 [Sesbania bispinosa]|nr:hypothetical protein SESBI_19435 [Sesbania bispinosa]KAJ1415686.1 hypothetical protein SESBI_17894 [Sesbania bispinosa]